MRACYLMLPFLSAILTASPFKFEGVFGEPVENISNMNGNAALFLPYNPVIVEIGAHTGQGTVSLAEFYRYGTIIAFEPHPEAFSTLAQKVLLFKHVTPVNLAVGSSNKMATLWGSPPLTSLLHLPTKRAQNSPINIPCVILDDWCQKNGIENVHFLRLDANGLEWQIIQSSPRIMETVLVIVTKTYLSPPSTSTPKYLLLKQRLAQQGFEMLSHWYEEGKEGEATFVRKYLYDSLFR